jgi:hypothetical protein
MAYLLPEVRDEKVGDRIQSARCSDLALLLFLPHFFYLRFAPVIRLNDFSVTRRNKYRS